MEHLQVLDRKIGHLLYTAVKALTKNLKSKDWRCRASAIEQVLKMPGRFLARISITGQVDHSHQYAHAVRFGELPESFNPHRNAATGTP